MMRARGARTRAVRGKSVPGQSLVELTLALPLLLLLLGTVDMGRMFFDTIQLRNAVREGAGYGAHFPMDTSGMTSRVTSHGVPGGTTVSASCSGSCSGSNGVSSGLGVVTVTANYLFTPITTRFLQSWFGMRPVTLGASASMNVLQ